VITNLRAKADIADLKRMLKGITIREVMLTDFDSLNAEMTVREAVNVIMKNHAKYFILLSGAMPLGIISRIEVLEAKGEMRFGELIKNLRYVKVEFVYGEEEVEKFITTLSKNTDRLYPVMENNYLAGAINFECVIEYLLLQKRNTGEHERIRKIASQY
jgi:predicted transcriptional regulator